MTNIEKIFKTVQECGYKIDEQTLKDILKPYKAKDPIDKDKHKFIYLEELVYDYDYTDCDIYKILLNQPYKFTMSEVKEKVRYCRLEQYIEDLEISVNDGFLTQSVCDNLIQNFREYYAKKQYKLIKDVYNSLLY